MVLMGRSPERLRVAADQAGVPDAETRTAGLDDAERLTASLRGCAALINCAGPFTRSGEALARAAIAAGCHYTDTSGEQLHIKQIFDTLAADAERGGVTVVPAATDGGVPGDLIAHLLAERVEPVRRSLPPEVITVPRHVRVRRVEGVADSALLARLTSTVDPALIDRMPEGPPEERRRAQEFTIVVDAVGRDGRSARGVVTGPDTYGTTAVIAVEAARRLATGSAEPGVLAPAQAFDPTDFLDFLAPHGITWNIDTHDRPTADA